MSDQPEFMAPLSNDHEAATAQQTFEEVLLDSVAPANPAFLRSLGEHINTITSDGMRQYSLGMEWLAKNTFWFGALTASHDPAPFFRGLKQNPYVLQVLYMPEVLNLIHETEVTGFVQELLEEHTPQDLVWINHVEAAGVDLRHFLGDYLVSRLGRYDTSSQFQRSVIDGYGPGVYQKTLSPSGGEEYVHLHQGCIWGRLTGEQLAGVVRHTLISEPAKMIDCGSKPRFLAALERYMASPDLGQEARTEGAQAIARLVDSANFAEKEGLTRGQFCSLPQQTQQLLLNKPKTGAVHYPLIEMIDDAMRRLQYSEAVGILKVLARHADGHCCNVRETLVTVLEVLARHQTDQPGLCQRIQQDALEIFSLGRYRFGLLEQVKYRDLHGNPVTTHQAVKSTNGRQQPVYFVSPRALNWSAVEPGDLVMFDPTGASRLSSDTEVDVRRVHLMLLQRVSES